MLSSSEKKNLKHIYTANYNLFRVFLKIITLMYCKRQFKWEKLLHIKVKLKIKFIFITNYK